jgi:hypothetical protein
VAVMRRTAGTFCAPEEAANNPQTQSVSAVHNARHRTFGLIAKAPSGT